MYFAIKCAFLSKVTNSSFCMEGSMLDTTTNVNTIQEQIFDREYFLG